MSYQGIRSSVNNCQLLQKTVITLYNVNETTLMLWYKDNTRKEETATLLHVKDLPGTIDLTTTNQPRQMSLPTYEAQIMEFPQGEDIV